MKKRLLPVLFLLFALLPEYIAPILAITVFALTLRFKNGFSFSPIQKAFTVFFTYMIIGLFYSENIVSGLAFTAVWLFAFTANIAVLSFADSEEKIRSLIFCGALSGGIAGCIGIIQMFLFHYGALIHKPLKGMFNPFWHLLDTAVAKFCTETLLPDSILAHFNRTEFIYIPQRASGTFTNPIFYALFLVIAAPLAAHCMFFADSKKKKIIGFFCFIFSISGIALSYSRGPYLAIAVAFTVLFFHGRKYFLKLLLTAVGLLFIIAATSSGVFKRLLTIFSSDDISINTRSDIFKACFDMLDGHLIFGYGTGVANVGNQLKETYSINQPHAHNLFLEILLENGLIGALLLAAAFVVFLIRIIRLYKKDAFTKSVAVTCLSSFFGFCVCSLTDYTIYGIKPIFYLMFIFAIADATLSLQKTSSDIPYTTQPKELTYER